MTSKGSRRTDDPTFAATSARNDRESVRVSEGDGVPAIEPHAAVLVLPAEIVSSARVASVRRSWLLSRRNTLPDSTR